MKLYAAITKLDAEQRLVFGYASTEALDSQNEIVKREALEAALPAYLKFANVREMHQPSAVGIAHQAEVDDKGLYIAARVVDPLAWEKVKAGVYKGFSIGGNALKRDPKQRHVITALELTEISLVDRPANPEAVFDLYKSRAEGAAAAADQPQWRQNLSAAIDAALDSDDVAGNGDLLNALEALQEFLENGDAGPEDESEDDTGNDNAPEDEDDDSEIENFATVGGLKKFEDTIAKMSLECRRLAAEIERLSAQPHPAKGVLRVIGKGDDGFAKAEEPQDVFSAIKQAHRQPMRLV